MFKKKFMKMQDSLAVTEIELLSQRLKDHSSLIGLKKYLYFIKINQKKGGKGQSEEMIVLKKLEE